MSQDRAGTAGSRTAVINRGAGLAKSGGTVGARVAVFNGGAGLMQSVRRLEGAGVGRGGGEETGRGADAKELGLPEIGPPKRVMLLPEVHPR